MGQTPTQTVTEIEQTRRRLDAELAELESYLPGTSGSLKRIAAAAAGAVAGLWLLGTILRRRRDLTGLRKLRAIERRLGTIEERLERSAVVRVAGS